MEKTKKELDIGRIQNRERLWGTCLRVRHKNKFKNTST